MSTPDQEAVPSPEEQLSMLVEELPVYRTLDWMEYARGPFWKQYGNTSDPDGEWTIVTDEESRRTSREAADNLIQFVSSDSALLPLAIRTMDRKLQGIPRGDPYEIGHTETGYPFISPEPGAASRWQSYFETKKVMTHVIKGLGKQADQYLKGTEFDYIGRRLKRLFTHKVN